MQIELKRIQEQTEKTFLFVTHDQEEALTMSDTVVVMNAGRIEQMGSPTELYHRPKGRFVAGFIGETNLSDLRGQGGRTADSLRLDWAGTPLIAEAPDPAPRARPCMWRCGPITSPARGTSRIPSTAWPAGSSSGCSRVRAPIWWSMPATSAASRSGSTRSCSTRAASEIWLGWPPERMVVLAD